jgi:hypothetical protein
MNSQKAVQNLIINPFVGGSFCKLDCWLPVAGNHHFAAYLLSPFNLQVNGIITHFKIGFNDQITIVVEVRSLVGINLVFCLIDNSDDHSSEGIFVIDLLINCEASFVFLAESDKGMWFLEDFHNDYSLSNCFLLATIGKTHWRIYILLVHLGDAHLTEFVDEIIDADPEDTIVF